MPGLQRAGDRLVELRLRLNRSVLHAYRGELQAATRDLETAIGLARELDQGLLMARCAHNLGFVAGRARRRAGGAALVRRGRAALPRGRARRRLAARCWRSIAPSCCCPPGWPPRRAPAPGSPSRALVASGNAAEEAEARLLGARAALAAGEHDAAVEEAAGPPRRSGASGARRGRCSPTPRRSARTRRPPTPTCTAARATPRCSRGGWSAPAAAPTRARRTSSRGGWRWPRAIGRPRARALAAVGRARPGQPALLRIQAWHATALLRALEGDRPAPGAPWPPACGCSTATARRSAPRSCAPASRCTAWGSPASRCGWRWRPTTPGPRSRPSSPCGPRACELPPARPPRDDELAASLAELRALDADLRAAPTDPASHDRLLRRRAAMEAEVRGRVLAPGRRATRGRRPPGCSAARGWSRARRRDAARVLRGGRHAARHRRRATAAPSLHRLGAADDAAAETAALLFALRRLVRRGGSGAATAAALASLEASAGGSRELVLPRSTTAPSGS